MDYMHCCLNLVLMNIQIYILIFGAFNCSNLRNLIDLCACANKKIISLIKLNTTLFTYWIYSVLIFHIQIWKNPLQIAQHTSKFYGM